MVEKKICVISVNLRKSVNSAKPLRIFHRLVGIEHRFHRFFLSLLRAFASTSASLRLCVRTFLSWLLPAAQCSEQICHLGIEVVIVGDRGGQFGFHGFTKLLSQSVDGAFQGIAGDA